MQNKDTIAIVRGKGLIQSQEVDAGMFSDFNNLSKRIDTDNALTIAT